jgi:hypothetical protein
MREGRKPMKKATKPARKPAPNRKPAVKAGSKR